MVAAYLGQWRGDVTTKYFSGEIVIDITDDNGNYKVDVALPGRFSRAKPQFNDIKETENGLTGSGLIKILKSFTINATISFDGDKMDCAIEVPQVLLSFNIKNGHRA